MRTTLEIEDEVFRQAKIRAAEAGRTMGELVTLALRDVLNQRVSLDKTPFAMPVFGDSLQKLSRSVSSLSALRDDGR